jgi:hypothetical protein
MKKYLIIITVVALAVLSACSGEDSHKQKQSYTTAEQLPIKLGSSLGDETRSNNATNLINGDTVWVWTDMINGATQAVGEYFKAWALKANGVGGLSTLQAGNTKLFPATNVLNFYAMVGNFGKVTEGERIGLPMIDAENDPLPTTGIRHTVMSNQTTPENYYKSDLLYAVVKNQAPISEAVVLPFKHLLSRIQVVLVAGNGVTTSDLDSATVTLLNLKRQIAFNPDKEADFSSQSALAGLLSWSNLFQTSDILMATNKVASVDEATAANSTAYADAIVVPQTIAKGANFIKVEYLGRTTYYRIPNGANDEDLELESGKQYRFRLIANRIGSSYEMTVTVSDWDVQAGEAMWAE